MKSGHTRVEIRFENSHKTTREKEEIFELQLTNQHRFNGSTVFMFQLAFEAWQMTPGPHLFYENISL